VGYNLSDIYPSAFFKAADLSGKTVTKEVADVTLEEIGTDRKLVLHFTNEDKGLVLNKTNSNNIALVYGMDTDGWIGAHVQLYPTMVDFQGRSTEAIRIKAIARASGKRQGPSRPQLQRQRRQSQSELPTIRAQWRWNKQNPMAHKAVSWRRLKRQACVICRRRPMLIIMIIPSLLMTLHHIAVTPMGLSDV
jgi:hypothetical protein